MSASYAPKLSMLHLRVAYGVGCCNLQSSKSSSMMAVFAGIDDTRPGSSGCQMCRRRGRGGEK
ncbi:hypothetical protein IG631_06568 [Alternaria alternata]|nr:hypothetical protein IG631_06568 [Alternaria alternata]